AEKGPSPGLARVRLTVTASGPAGLEIDPRLEDPTEAWKANRYSAWRQADRGAVWSDTLDLVQVKPGVGSLPGLRVRCREGPPAPGGGCPWPDTPRGPRAAPPIEQLPPLPPSPWRVLLPWAAGALAGTLLLAGGAWAVRRRRRARPPPLPAHEQA